MTTFALRFSILPAVLLASLPAALAQTGAELFVKSEQVEVRAKCSDTATVVATLSAAHPVRLRFALAGSSSRCYSIVTEIGGRTIRGYVPRDSLEGTDSFEQARRDAATEQILEAATESIIVGRSSKPSASKKNARSRTRDRATTDRRGLIGRPAADFTLSDFSRRAYRLRNLRGKVVLLNFWASWCGPCRVDLPRVQSLHQSLGGRGLVTLGINSEPPAKAREYVDSQGLTFPTLVDQGGGVAHQYLVRGIPTVIVIDRAGNVASYLVGVHSEEQMRAEVLRAGL